MKRVLVVHNLSHHQRRTTFEFVSSFGRYSPDGVETVHHNIRRPLTARVTSRRFDAVLLTYDVLALRSVTEQWAWAMDRLATLCALADTVIAFPQDDYTYNGVLDSSLEALGVEIIYTPIETGLDIVYPAMHRQAEFRHAHTGYVDEETAMFEYARRLPMATRHLHVGQRVRMLPPWFGRAGQVKGLFAERFAEAARQEGGLAIDISTRDEDAFSGDDWYRFLGSTRATIGQKGGASLCDPDGGIMRTVVEYCERNPDAEFDEIESECFPGLDGRAEMKAISPRLFDAAMIGTAQVLIEDDYLGEFEPWVHYVPTDEEVSNIDEIAAALREPPLLERLAEAAYNALVRSGRYTYRAFVAAVYEASIGDAHHPSRASASPDLADELQWRLSPVLFEGVQRMATLASTTGSIDPVARLIDNVTDVLAAIPELLDYVDDQLVRKLLGDHDVDRRLNAFVEPLVALIGEVVRAGAGRATAQWLRSFDPRFVSEWELGAWTDQDRVLLDQGMEP